MNAATIAARYALAGDGSARFPGDTSDAVAAQRLPGIV